MSTPHDVLRRDPVMDSMIERHGIIALELAEDEFTRLVVSVINQQLSSASAGAIRDRVFDQFEVTPDGILDAGEDALRETGLSRQKISYIKNIAEAFTERDYSRDALANYSNEEVIDLLTEIKGVGVWTGRMYLMFVLGREDVFPVEDLGIRRGMEILYGLEDRPAMIEKSEDWRPYRTYASRYLWRATDE